MDPAELSPETPDPNAWDYVPPPEEEPEKKKSALFAKLDALTEERPWVLFPFAYLFLNVFMNLREGVGFIEAALRPSPEVAFVVFIVSISVAIRAFRASRADDPASVSLRPNWFLIFACFLFLAFTRLVWVADDLMMETFGRKFVFADFPQWTEGMLVLDESWGRGKLVGFMAASALILGLLLFFVRQSVLLTAAFAAKRPLRIGAIAVSMLLLSAGLLSGATSASASMRTFEVVKHHLASADRATELQAVLRAKVESSAKNGGERFAGADVSIIFVPSYGAALFDEPIRKAMFSPKLASVQESLMDAGFSIRTGRLRAPTKSGMPRLTRATFLRGMELVDDSEVAALQDAPESLVSYFRNGGYRTLRIAASTKREREDLSGIEYDRVYHSWDLGYHGPKMGNSSMPDQYVFDTIKRYEFDLIDQPLLTVFELSSCGTPFNARPQLLAEKELGDGSIFKEHPPITYSHDTLSLDEPSAVTGHLESTAYTLSAFADFVTRIILVPPKSKKRHRKERQSRRKSGAAVYVIVGEHQPPPHSGYTPSDSDVVVHLVSKDPKQIAFVEGFAEGMMTLPASAPMDGFAWQMRSAPSKEVEE